MYKIFHLFVRYALYVTLIFWISTPKKITINIFVWSIEEFRLPFAVLTEIYKFFHFLLKFFMKRNKQKENKIIEKSNIKYKFRLGVERDYIPRIIWVLPSRLWFQFSWFLPSSGSSTLSKIFLIVSLFITEDYLKKNSILEIIPFM